MEAWNWVQEHFMGVLNAAGVIGSLLFTATAKEEFFITSLILHLYCAYRGIRRGMYPKLEGLQRDIREFYSLPIPSQVWERMKVFQDRDFVSFVDDALRT